MPQKKIKTEDVPAVRADIVNFPVQPEVSRAEMALRNALGTVPVNEDAFSRLLQCVRNIQRTKDKISRLLQDLGADLLLMHESTTEIVAAEYGDTRAARSRARDMFFIIAEEALDLTRSQAQLYLSLYHRFLQHNGALSKLNIGELMVLRRRDYSSEEIDAVIEFKENDPAYHRKDIRKFVERLRKQEEEVIDVQTKLDIATAELASTVSENADKDFEIRRLNTELGRLASERDADREALSHVREEMTRQNLSYSAIRMQIDDLEREKRELQERMAFSKANTRPETVEVQIVPPGYASLEEALAAKNDELSSAKADLADIQSRRQQIECEIAERSSVLDRRARARDDLAKLVTQFEQILSTFASAQLTVHMAGDISEFRPALTVLDSIISRLHADIRSALNAR
ncbi:hypothetical protein [Cupriavidus sp. BIC8F]|uniref:hypothetical protein n=1 Tax=Cupriavidus sp. BIC8F TaxID=3079014 RepID=UPI002916139A|nr:hypothetical protein [Cupriavidus sp. BIC8F]